MGVEKVVGGVGDIIILKLENGLFAIVDTDEELVQYNWYWLYFAKYEPIRSEDQLDSYNVKRAKEILSEDEPEEGLFDALQKEAEEHDLNYIMKEQDELIEQSKQKKKGIYLS